MHDLIHLQCLLYYQDNIIHVTRASNLCQIKMRDKIRKQ